MLYKDKAIWKVIGKSVKGASHQRLNLPCQDALQLSPETGESESAILSIADGHGDAKNFRSDTGARLAVKAAMNVTSLFLAAQLPTVQFPYIRQWAQEKFPREVVHKWRNEVTDHLYASPVTTSELEHLEKKKGVDTRRQAVLDPIRAYGATLIVVAVAESWIMYGQLGDGEILTVSETGEVARPMKHDKRLFANETTSLCCGDAWRDFRICLQPIIVKPPALILCCTDGYSNSFIDDENFLMVGRDIYNVVREYGIDAVQSKLESWLTEASESGSGDDITLGIMCRIGAFTQSTLPKNINEPGPSDAKEPDEKIIHNKINFVSP